MDLADPGTETLRAWRQRREATWRRQARSSRRQEAREKLEEAVALLRAEQHGAFAEGLS